MNPALKLNELAEQSGVPARTIRLYIAQGLLPPPHRAGPNSSYGHGHLRRLGQIRILQQKGLTLSEIRRQLDGPAPRALPAPETIQRFALAPDVSVEIRGPVSPWRARQIHKALTELAASITPSEGAQP